MTDVQQPWLEAEEGPTAPCSLCGKSDPGRVNDRLLIQTPGTARRCEAVCRACGRSLARVVKRFGTNLTVQVEEGQGEAGERDGSAAARKHGDRRALRQQ